ncbi:ABC transporter permease [Cohnella thailandensis]|uniref:ABC transporter permease n=1 Tax=Cohnella thailandensis TaxID=557557 RepID=A0A841SYN0_9BACL|nr:ABC transporter permease [Cohnella thailandensis]MBB6637323.1 ABC transporter permease [Cohnella thailandensis]MBP1976651.1 ABC-2 type transport system permease protein [Cohnella thailandensis]
MNNLWTVTAFTMRTKLRGKSFLTMTILISLLLVVGSNLPYLIDKMAKGGGAVKVGYAQGEQAEVMTALSGVLASLPEPKIELVPVETPKGETERSEAMKQAIEDKTIKGYLEFESAQGGSFPSVTYLSKKTLSEDASQQLQAALQTVKTDAAVKDANLTQEQLAKLSEPVAFDSIRLDELDGSGKTQEEKDTALLLTYVILILLFMSVMVSGQMIASEITSEKSSRVMEILVTSVAPLQQLFGRVLGTFVVAVLQLIVFVAVTVGNLSLPHNKDSFASLGIDFGNVDPLMLIFAVLLYLAGFFLYAMLFAAIGSIVSRTEDLGQAVMPITMITLAGFYIAIFGMNSPESSFITICSYIPFFSPFLLFLRIGLADPAWWEIALSVGILLASILAIGWLAAKIYRTGVLLYGKRPSIAELRKAMKAYKV